MVLINSFFERDADASIKNFFLKFKNNNKLCARMALESKEKSENQSTLS